MIHTDSTHVIKVWVNFSTDEKNSTNVHHVTLNTPMKASRTEVLISIGGCDRPGGYNSPYVESWHPQTKEWTQMAKLPNFTKTEYAVCNIKNHIIVTGGRIHQKEVWIYQVRFCDEFPDSFLIKNVGFHDSKLRFI